MFLSPCDKIMMTFVLHGWISITLFPVYQMKGLQNQNALNLYIVFNFKGSTQICRHFAHLICIIIIQHVTLMVRTFFYTYNYLHQFDEMQQHVFKKGYLLRATLNTL